LKSRLVSMVTVIFSAILLLASVSGCRRHADIQSIADIYSPLTTVLPSTSVTIIEGQIDFREFRVSSSFVTFSGTAGLSDGTVLHSQLSEGETLFSWWPTATDIIVQNNRWVDSVDLSEIGQTDKILIGPVYYYKIWQQDNLANIAGSAFDLVGPPPAEPWWQRGIFWLMIGIGIGILAVIAVIIFLIRARHRESNTPNIRP
jgi:hypothetical protein